MPYTNATGTSIVNTQTSIDSMMGELYRTKDSSYQSYEEKYQATMLLGIFVAMLGTSVLFYTFKQI